MNAMSATAVAPALWYGVVETSTAVMSGAFSAVHAARSAICLNAVSSGTGR